MGLNIQRESRSSNIMDNVTDCLSISGDAIKDIYEQDFHAPVRGLRPAFDFEWDEAYTTSREGQDGKQIIKYYTTEERHDKIMQTCNDLLTAAADVNFHVTKLEAVFTTLLSCQWRPEKLSTATIVDDTKKILQRLPHVSLNLPENLGMLPSGYFSTDQKEWNSLIVTSMVHRNLVCFAIYHIITLSEGGYMEMTLQEGLNHVAEIIQQCVENGNADVAQKPYWVLVRCYLWSFWQRARLLHSYFVMTRRLVIGLTENTPYQWMRNYQVSQGLSLRAFTEQAAQVRKPPEMCGWKCELIIGDPVCLGFDFTLLFRRFEKAFGAMQTSCHFNLHGACEGQDWHHCARFNRTEGANQTMHDSTQDHEYDNEPRVVWDEASYRRVEGARAVCISESDDSYFKYCTASQRTLAFSHVWSHGQGGRPHEGINRCLHHRYIQLAKQLGCDSYWIDSACIPEPDDLRKEAITHINDVFYESKYVLVCDKELMSINIDDLTTECYEWLLTGVLLSDWNIRAWTMLEALKGREHVAILCQGNKTVMFKDIIEQVCHNGRIDIAVFASLLPHMLPSQIEGRIKGKVLQEVSPNDISLEVIGSWLSHRPSSRKGDDVTIWSLCLNQHRARIKDVVEFWRQQKGVNSGFLLSSSDRLSQPGLSWAPSTPFALPESRDQELSIDLFHRPLDSVDTARLSIQPDGLWGQWWAYEHQVGLRASIGWATTYMSTTQRQTYREIKKIRRKFRLKARYIALLRPVSSRVYTRYDGATATPSASKSGILVAVCDSDHTERKQPLKIPQADQKPVHSYKWIWRGVYQWPTEVVMPNFVKVPDFWIG
ncbi:hypothetical protein F5B20DRAFT_539978 [Whalleya microplaca]|nr:hypothetical protein F5B20DRAFT_539978 [Whalleya microplaca]